MEIGFIGLGAMGEPMARNLLRAGHALKVYNRTRSRAEALAGYGATIVVSGVAQGMGEHDWSAVARVSALKAGLKG
jgi:3-hydroxyisobutyrate dehydrogenase